MAVPHARCAPPRVEPYGRAGIRRQLRVLPGGFLGRRSGGEARGHAPQSPKASPPALTAPVAVAMGEGCLATVPVCAAEIAEMATGGASGASVVVGAGAGLSAAARGAEAGALGIRREEYVAELAGGIVAKDAKAQDIKVVMPNVGSTCLDVLGPNGEYIFVGGGAKASNPANFGKLLKISKYAADQAGVSAKYYLADNTPEQAINQARKAFGADNVHVFTMPEK